MFHNLAMKITLYTINDCKFSTEEKDYLKSHNVAFEEKNLETSREYLTEMLAVSNNFAGTPVTKIEFDDGRVVVLKGFTKEEFDETLKLSDTAKMPAVDMAAAPMQQPPTVAPMQTSMPNEPASQAVVSAPVVPAAPAAANPWEQPAPVAPAPMAQAPAGNTDDPLNAILSDLQAKVNEAVATQPAPAAPMAAAPAPQTWAPPAAPVNEPVAMPQTPPATDWSAPAAPAPVAPVQNDWSMPPVQTQQPMAQAPSPQTWAPPASPTAGWSAAPAAPTSYGAPQASANPMGIPPMPGTNPDGTPTA